MDLFKAFKHEATPSRSGFDLSRKHVFSSKVGQLIPCLAVETVPGDHFEIDLASLSRTETFNTAAFLRGKQRFDFFFVPNSQTWHPFNQFITQRLDKHSTLQKGSLYCPTIRLDYLLQFIWNEWNADNVYDIQDFPFAQNAVRLLDMLGYGNFQWIFEITNRDVFNTTVQCYADKYVNIFRLAAYQHIWYDFYRNKYWDCGNTGGLYLDSNDTAQYTFSDYIEAFNFDDIPCSSIGSSHIDVPQSSGDNGYSRFVNLFAMRYAPWKKDLFTSAMPSNQFGAVSTVDISGVNIINSTIPSANTYSAVAGDTTLEPNKGKLFINGSSVADSSSWSIPSAFDVLSLRKSEALQQWKQNTLRGGNMIDDQMKSHYGVEPYYESDDNVNYLGSFSSSLQVNPVEATAASSLANGKVGDLGATGTIVTNGQKIKFDPKDFGIIMCVASYVPESEYSSNALDKANTLYEQFDFFTPEFQNIGLEAVPRSAQQLGKINSTTINQVIGYAPRYWMYKQAVDHVFGEFSDSVSPYSTVDHPIVTHQGSLQAWVSPRAEAFMFDSSSGEATGPRLIGSLYVNPRVYDTVSTIQADGDQDTDFFIHNVFFDIKAIRPMTVLGLPQF